jgi:hypothetical protein
MVPMVKGMTERGVSQPVSESASSQGLTIGARTACPRPSADDPCYLLFATPGGFGDPRSNGNGLDQARGTVTLNT